MRADRLLAMLLVLQAHGRMSAARLAERLEVSKRTVYRDVDALGAAGVPVVTETGRLGGIQLLDGWRTDLTGLSDAELNALFATAGDAALAALGAGRSHPASAGDRVLVDSTGWGRRSETPAHLRLVQDAVFAERRLRLRYRRAEAGLVERLVDPYGLVAKAGVWYLLGLVDGGQRLFRLSRVEAAELLDERFVRRPGFDLRAAWRERLEAMSPARPAFEVTARVAPGWMGLVLRVAGERVDGVPEGDTVRFRFPALEAARALLLSFGTAVEVIEPAPLRAALAEAAGEVAALYKGQPGTVSARWSRSQSE